MPDRRASGAYLGTRTVGYRGACSHCMAGIARVLFAGEAEDDVLRDFSGAGGVSKGSRPLFVASNLKTQVQSSFHLLLARSFLETGGRNLRLDGS